MSMISRRDFVGEGLGFAALTGLGGCRLWSGSDAFAGIDVPSTATPNYWCTWCTQDAALVGGRLVLPPSFAGDASKATCRDGMNETSLFRKGGWVDFYPAVRSDLFLLLDDGWDVPFGATSDVAASYAHFGTMAPDPVRFASFKGTAAERVRAIRDRVVAGGWRGLGVWVSPACQACKQETPDLALSREEWTRKLEDMAAGGVGYLKVDWGRHDVPEFRALLTELCHKICPGTIVEHAQVQGPTNGLHFDENQRVFGTCRRIGDPTDETWLRKTAEKVMPHSDVWRIYDMMEKLQTVMAAERIACYQELADRLRVGTILCAEDRVYEGAVMGCSFGVMRSAEMKGYFPDDIERSGACLVEVERAVRWQRLAPAFGWRAGFEMRHSDKTLYDEASYKKGEHWCAFVKDGGTLRQGGPAVLARGLPLPEVTPEKGGDVPFAMAARHPNGALSVGVMPRMPNGQRVTPKVTVRLDAELGRNGLLGAFGRFGAFDVGVAKDATRVWACDLADSVPQDVTSSCRLSGGRLLVPGTVLEDVCRARSTDGSAPGVAFAVS